MFRRAVGSLLARRFSPRATPRTPPARSLHSLRDLAIGDGLLSAYIFAAGTLAGGAGALVAQHFKEGTGLDESGDSSSSLAPFFMSRTTTSYLSSCVSAGKVTGARNNKVKFKKPDTKERFERWIIKNKKMYRDEEEKAMRFELFKAALQRMESQIPSVKESVVPEISCFADFTEEERRKMLAFPDGIDRTEFSEMVKSAWANQGTGEPVIRRPDMEQGDTLKTTPSPA